MENKPVNPVYKYTKRVVVLVIASLIMAFNIKSFVNTAELYPGGFTGLAVLLQRIAKAYFNTELPYSALYYPLNCIPIYIGFKYIGKKYTFFSLMVVIMTGAFTDLLPTVVITYDPLLLSIFGGILSGLGGVLCYWNDANGGGTDFIATWLSIRRKVDSFNIIMGFNILLMIVAGILFGFEKCLYSIIFQYATTQTIHLMYHKYQQNTLIVVTDKPKEIAATIFDRTRHGATILHGEGGFQGQEHTVLYSVVSREETGQVLKLIRECDKKAFVNVFRTEQVKGEFYQKPAD
ncbi:MAG: YitT family protein [Lachnospiraceae bacterium]|nr:YitT family protein [Lachnospiraceae bacterium]